jgi:cellulose synthase (UDP-forming)
MEAFAPLLIVIGAVLILPRRVERSRLLQWVIAIGGSVLLLRYLNWRYFETVAPADPMTVAGAVVWVVFAFEALAWIDAGILFAFLLKRTDRSAEANWHEDELRSLNAESFPEVDVFIATYNEPVEVLEKTITGATALDWPADKLNIWVLDDGKRDWLRQLCGLKNTGYLTRDNNRHAKAGNINAAIKRTSAPFFLVLDADFIPQRNFLMRTMGFFDDPGIGIVQVPHNFFNPDPMQNSLNMSKAMPDDQRFFFEAIMPGRDGFDCAFCCGSNGIVRRAAMNDIGGEMPTGSITEDMLLTMALLRKGYVTRYLEEPLAFGLAPESINAFFVQRARWARGGIQMLFIKEGPLGPGLKLYQRIAFLPLHWITQTTTQVMMMALPAFFLLTGIPPLLNTTGMDVIAYQAPTILATIAAIRMFAPSEYHPLGSTVLALLQAFRLLPVVVSTLLKPHGHAFKVTPKGGGGELVQDTATVLGSLGLVALTGLGLLINAFPETRLTPFSELVPVVAFWCVVNMSLLLIVAKVAISPPAQRSEERIEIDESVRIYTKDTVKPGHAHDMSLTGVRVEIHGTHSIEPGDWLAIEIAGIGLLPAIARRVSSEGAMLGIEFKLPTLEHLLTEAGNAEQMSSRARHDMASRDALIRKLFTEGRAEQKTTNLDGWKISWGMLSQVFAPDRAGSAIVRSSSGEQQVAPAWLRSLIAAQEGTEGTPPSRSDAA